MGGHDGEMEMSQLQHANPKLQDWLIDWLIDWNSQNYYLRLIWTPYFFLTLGSIDQLLSWYIVWLVDCTFSWLSSPRFELFLLFLKHNVEFDWLTIIKIRKMARWKCSTWSALNQSFKIDWLINWLKFLELLPPAWSTLNPSFKIDWLKFKELLLIPEFNPLIF